MTGINIPRRIRSRLARRSRVAMLAAAAVVACSAAAPVSASAYMFQPGHPMFFYHSGSWWKCTGGYAIRGGSGTFALTAGHCANPGETVFGTSRAFGYVAYSRCAPLSSCRNDVNYGVDSELVTVRSPDGIYQTVQDPVTGRTPNGSGKVVGQISASQLVNGFVVGKMGATSGWTEGRIYRRVLWHNMTAYCTYAQARGGDSGGPVWQAAVGGGVKAVGITVAEDLSTGGDCFLPITDLERVWGGYLPVWSSAKAYKRDEAAPRSDRGGEQPPLVRHARLRALDGSAN